MESRKVFGLSLKRGLMLEIQRLALDMDRFVNDVMEEAMQDILKKYREKKKALTVTRVRHGTHSNRSEGLWTRILRNGLMRSTNS